MSNTSNGIGELLQGAENLRSLIPQSDDTAMLNTNFLHLSQEYSRGGQVEEADVKARLFLASRGIDIGSMQKKLTNATRGIAMETDSPATANVGDDEAAGGGGVDVEAYVMNEMQKAMMLAMRTTCDEVSRRVEDVIAKRIDEEHEIEKRHLIDSLSIAKHKADLLRGDGVSCLASQDIVNSSLGVVGFQHALQYEYAQTVCNYIQQNASAAEMLQMLKTAMAESPFASDIFQFIQSINGTDQNDDGRLHAALRHLQLTERQRALSTLADKNVEGMQLVASYVASLPIDKSLYQLTADGVCLWVVCFYAIVFGYERELAVWTRKVGEDDVADFLSKDGANVLKLKQSLGNLSNRDAYRMLVLSLLADSSIDSHLIDDLCSASIDILMIVKLKQLQNHYSAAAVLRQKPKLDIQHLQQLVDEPRFFANLKNRNEIHDEFVAFLFTLQFEKALAYLYRCNVLMNQSHAVHFAIAFRICRVLNISENVKALLLTATKDALPRLNIVRMIFDYASSIKTNNYHIPLSYYALMKDISDENGCDMFTHGALELVDGHSLPIVADFINRFLETSFLQTLAKALESNGNLILAVDCFHRLNQIGKVKQLLGTMLAEVLTAGESENRKNVHALALGYFESYRNLQENDIDSTTFACLLDLYDFFSFLLRHDYSNALGAIRALNLFPVTAEEMHMRKTGLRHFNNDLIRVLPDVLVAYMKCLAQEYSRMKVPSAADQNISAHNSTQNEFFASFLTSNNISSSDSLLNPATRLKCEAKCLIEFVSLLNNSYTFPPTLFSRLTSTQLLLT